MRIPRFSTSIPNAVELLKNKSSTGSIELQLSDSQTHHLTNVIRISTGETVEVIDSSSAITVRGVVSKIENGSLAIAITEVLLPADLQLTLILALIKPTILEDVVDKATQLGVTKFCFYHAERSKFRFDESKQLQKAERFKRISEAALKQSGSSLWPDFCFHQDLNTALNSLTSVAKTARRFILLANTLDSLSEKPTNFTDLLADSPRSQKVTTEIIVGPEGGLCQSEVEAALRHGFIATSLGEKTLRAETAAIVAAGICATFAQASL